MFGFGFGEILLLMAIGLIVLGPKQMPQVARVIGKTIGELKKALREVTSSVTVDFKDVVEKEKPQSQSPAQSGVKGESKISETKEMTTPENVPPQKEYIPHKPFVFQDLPPDTPNAVKPSNTPKKEDS